MDAEDNKILQIGGDTEANSGSSEGNMSITEKAANDGLETENQGTLLRCIDNQTVRRLVVYICSLLSNTQFIRKMEVLVTSFRGTICYT